MTPLQARRGTNKVEFVFEFLGYLGVVLLIGFALLVMT